MSYIENYPVLQLVISALLIVLAVMLIIMSITIKKKFKNLDFVFSITIFSIGVFILVFSIVNFMFKAIFELKVNGG